jgi:multicomponent Na+:H+ antiporter subunit D
VPALSLAGIPPLSGFVAKLGLVEAGIESRDYVLVGVLLVVSLLTLFSMMKIWSAVFWSPVEGDAPAEAHPVGRLGGPPLMVVPTIALAVLSVAIAVAAGPLYDLSQRAAVDLLDTSAYTQAVLGR